MLIPSPVWFSVLGDPRRPKPTAQIWRQFIRAEIAERSDYIHHVALDVLMRIGRWEYSSANVAVHLEDVCARTLRRSARRASDNMHCLHYPALNSHRPVFWQVGDANSLAALAWLCPLCVAGPWWESLARLAAIGTNDPPALAALPPAFTCGSRCCVSDHVCHGSLDPVDHIRWNPHFNPHKASITLGLPFLCFGSAQLGLARGHAAAFALMPSYRSLAKAS